MADNENLVISRASRDNRNRLSWWFPRIPVGIPVPKTMIMRYDNDDLVGLLDREVSDGLKSLCFMIREAGERFGWPLFLRTDYLSGKHDWDKTCCVASAGHVPDCVVRLIEASVMADAIGFPVDGWAVREMIPTTYSFKAFRGKMPIVKERRYFVKDGEVICHHPYWPREAFATDRHVTSDMWQHRLTSMNREGLQEVNLLSEMSSIVGEAIGGSWSIDWLWSARHGRWYLTDMAEADVSYHWSGCEKHERGLI